MIAKALTLSVSIALGTLSLVSCSASTDENASVKEEAKHELSTVVEATVDGELITSKAEFEKAAESLEPGDTLVLANGVWQDFEVVLSGVGTAENPITLKAQTNGQVILSGLSNLQLSGEHLVVEGLVFKDGYSPTGEVISFREGADKYANHSRVTQTVIDGFSNPDKFNADKWVVMYGKNNRFDHNHLEGKSNAGVTMAVRLNSLESQENHHRIEHNYFGPRPILGSNGGETLRIGTSKFSLTDSYTLVENNYFDRCNGEVEIISNKSGKNQFKNNVFFESRGTLTLRHGNGNLVEGNVFFGNSKHHTGGIRVINADQTIRNNYMEGLTGIRFGGGFTVMNGVPNSSINRYHQVNNATIQNNTIVNVDNINLAAGSDAERSATPINSHFSNNLIVNSNGTNPFNLFDDVSGITFSNNIVSQPVQDKISTGFAVSSGDLVRAENGLLQSESAQAKNVGAASSISPIDRADTGVSWYPKADAEVSFDSGREISITSAETLTKAIAEAENGDILLLQSGDYSLNKQLQVKSIVTLKAVKARTVTLYPMRSLMFEIEDGGSLKLDGLNISGAKAPDNAGNVLIRNTKLPTLHNYKLAIHNTHISNLDVNHSAHVFDAGYRSLADNISIIDSVFENITGDVLRLDKEQDDLGIYNAEYVTIKNSTFRNIGGAVAKVYRGGTDESTFGPHFTITGSHIEKVGSGKRNKSHSSIYLLGVQQSLLEDNYFTQSKIVTIDHTVGEPRTQIIDNTFEKTPLPQVTETFAKGPSTAVLKGNKVQ